MLDIKFIRENPDVVRKAVKDKQLSGTVDIDELLHLDREYTATLRKVESHRNLRNELSRDVSRFEGPGREKLILEAKKIKDELRTLEEKLKEQKERIDKIMLWVPNPSADDVPYGEGDTGNVVYKTWGEIPKFDFEPLDHLTLGSRLGIIDTERGAKIGGFRAYFLKGLAADLEQAVLKFALSHMKKQGFEFLTVPWMVNKEFFVGTGYFPWGEEDHFVTQDEQGLIGTAEVSLTSYYANEVIDEEALPVKLVGISPCFRREVGSYGKDTKGVFRVHQFSKVEQVVLLPEGEGLSREWHEKMLGFSEDVLQALELPYHVLLMCTGDMGAGQRKKYDIETWFPAQRKYRETHSDSYFLDFQARRLNMRYKTKKGELKFVFTLNNTVAATPRLVAAIIENYQQKDGSIKIPTVLEPYM